MDGSISTKYLLATLEVVDAQTGERVAIAIYRKSDTGTNRGCDGFTYDLTKLQDTQITSSVKVIATLATGHSFTVAEIGA